MTPEQREPIGKGDTVEVRQCGSAPPGVGRVIFLNDKCVVLRFPSGAQWGYGHDDIVAKVVRPTPAEIVT